MANSAMGPLEGENETIGAMVAPDDRTILDIGCGTGRLGMRLKAAREDRIVWGMERDRAAAQQASHRLDRVIVGDVESFPVLPLPDNAFDVIVCGDVLEHLRDPWAFVERLKPHLAPGGRLLCCVPNIGHHSVIKQLLGGGFWYAGRGLLDQTHLRFFTKSTFATLLFRSGFRLLSVRALNISEPEVQEPLVRAGESLDMEPDRVRADTSAYQYVFEATPLEPQIVKAGFTLGPATNQGVSIIIVSYNSEEVLPACLASLESELGPDDEVIIVDNASSDRSHEVAKAWCEGRAAKAIASGSNTGFAAGCNLGIAACAGRYILLLNPDTQVRPGAIRRMASRFENDSVAAVGPLSDFAAGLQFVGHHLQATEHGERVLNVIPGTEALETRMLTGFCIMLRRTALAQAGPLDEAMFLGSEDIELCWRLRSHGHRLVIARDAFVHHAGGISRGEPSAEVRELIDRSDEALLRKLTAAYAPGPVPSSHDLWDSWIFPLAPNPARI